MADVPESPSHVAVHIPARIPAARAVPVGTGESDHGNEAGIGDKTENGSEDDLSSAVAAARSALDSLIEGGGATVAVSELVGADLAALDRSLRLLEAAVVPSTTQPHSRAHPHAPQHTHSHPRRPGPFGGGMLLNDLDARILEGVAVGVSSVQLAARLYLSRQGVEYHIGSMLRRFRVPNRTALACKAYSMGLFGGGGWPPKVRPEFIVEG